MKEGKITELNELEKVYEKFAHMDGHFTYHAGDDFKTFIIYELWDAIKTTLEIERSK